MGELLQVLRAEAPVKRTTLDRACRQAPYGELAVCQCGGHRVVDNLWWSRSVAFIVSRLRRRLQLLLHSDSRSRRAVARVVAARTVRSRIWKSTMRFPVIQTLRTKKFSPP